MLESLIQDLKNWLGDQKMPIVVTNSEGEIVHVTPDAGSVFVGYSEPLKIGANVLQWIRASYAGTESRQQIERLFSWPQNGSLRHIESMLLTADDHKSWKLTLVPQFTMENCSPLWLWVFQDASSSRLLEQHESHSKKMAVISRFAGGMAHEFNNLLTAILGNLDLARMDVSRPVAAVVDRLDAAEKAALRVNQLIVQLRRFASRDSMTQAVQPLLPVVQRVRTSLAALCDERIEITVAFASSDAGRMFAKFNAEQLEDALLKLGQNAVEAIGERRGAVNFDLQIVGANDSETLLITIEDMGSGMAPNAQSRAFEPFNTTKATNTPSGLGMAVAYGLIEEMNGVVQVLNSTQAGTDVRVSLPLSRFPTVAG